MGKGFEEPTTYALCTHISYKLTSSVYMSLYDILAGRVEIESLFINFFDLDIHH